MKNLKEEVDITPYVERGLVGVNVDAVRDNINTFLTGSLSKCFITPYIALEKIRKVLANFHIFLPKTTFLEGDRGVEVFQIKQFGEVMGMRDNGEVVTKIDDPYSLYFEYKMNDRGLFEIFCEIVNQEELDELLDQVEDDINDEDIEDDREERLDEVALAGPETGARRISGAPDSGMSMDYGSCDDMSKIKFVLRKKVMKKLKEEQTEPRPTPTGRSYTQGPGGIGNRNTIPATPMSPEASAELEKQKQKNSDALWNGIRTVVPGADAVHKASQGDYIDAAKSAAVDTLATATGVGAYKAAGSALSAIAPRLYEPARAAIQYGVSKAGPVSVKASSNYAQQNEEHDIVNHVRKLAMKSGVYEEKMKDNLQEARGLSKSEMKFVEQAKKILSPNEKRVKKVKLPQEIGRAHV